MNKFDDPVNFAPKQGVAGIEIIYSDLMEIVQGGPVVGNISINGKMVDGRFGGPALFTNEYVYVPHHVKKFLGTGFKLSRINTTTLEVESFGKTRDLIFLDKIENNRMCFFEDLNKTRQAYYELDMF